MALPTLTPASTVSAVTLPATGSHDDVHDHVPYKIYSDETSPLYSHQFVSGAVDQVSYVYKKLGGDVLDIELTPGNVYAAYEESVLEYSYLINVHQATNILSDALGGTTGSFDHKGILETGALSSSLGKNHVALKYPKFEYGMTRRIADGVASEVGLNASVQYSGSFVVTPNQQDYDLQKIFDSAVNVKATGSLAFSETVNSGGRIAPATGETFTLVDALGKQQIFTFNRENNDVGVSIGIAAASAAADGNKAPAIAAQVIESINSVSKIRIAAIVDEADNKKVNLFQNDGGSEGNTKIIDTSNANMTPTDFANGETNYRYGEKIKGKKILIKKVYYKTPHAMWRFYGYYGGLNVVGNLHNYGQFSDDSTFQLVPTWHNKAQALAFEDAIYTRMSHFSYELRNNTLRLFPNPANFSPSRMWVEFSIPEDVWDNDDKATSGVNNMNTLPMGNLPFANINAIGKQWIRRFALALSKEVLGQVRSKFGSVPIPGDSVTLNGGDLITQAKDEQEKLRTELKETLAELTYAKMAETDSAMLENSQKVLERIPNYIFVG